MGLPEWNKNRINNEDVRKKFDTALVEWEKTKQEDSNIKILNDDIGVVFSAEALKLSYEGTVYEYKDNYRDTLKGLIKLCLNKMDLIELEEPEKINIQTKIKIENGIACNEGDISDEMYEYAINNNLNISVTDEDDKPYGIKLIDPVQKYLSSNNEKKIKYTTEYLKNTCEKYGENINEKSNEEYAEILNKMRFYHDVTAWGILEKLFSEEIKINNITPLLQEGKKLNAWGKILNTKNEDGNTLFEHVVKKWNTEDHNKFLDKAEEEGLLKKILTAKDNNGNTVLHLVIINNKIEFSYILLNKAKEQALLEKMFVAQNNNCNTPLHLAIYNERTEFVEGLFKEVKGKEALLEEMLIAQNENGYTPLHLAVYNKYTKIVDKLFEEVKDKEALLKKMLIAQNKNGDTPLHLAIYKKQTNVVDKLFEEAKGKEALLKEMLAAKDKDGDTPLHLAIYNERTEFVERLFEEAKGEEALLKKMLIAQNKNGDTPLHLAIYKKQTNVVDKLFEEVKGKEALLEKMLIAQNKNGDTPLHLAVCNKDTNIVEKLFEEAKGEEALLKKMLAVQDNYGNTPLHLDITHTIHYSYIYYSYILLDKGKEEGILEKILAAKDNNGKTALQSDTNVPLYQIDVNELYILLEVNTEGSWNHNTFETRFQMLQYIDTAYAISTINNTFYKDTCNVLFEHESAIHQKCMQIGSYNTIAIAICMGSSLIAEETFMQHCIPIAAQPVAPLLLQTGLKTINHYLPSSEEDIITSALLCAVSLAFSYFPKLSCANIILKHVHTVISDSIKGGVTVAKQEESGGTYVLPTFITGTIAYETKHLLNNNKLAYKAFYVSIFYDFYNILTDVLDYTDKIIYSMMGKNFTKCKELYCTKLDALGTQLIVNSEKYKSEIKDGLIDKIFEKNHFGSYESVIWQTDAYNWCCPDTDCTEYYGTLLGFDNADGNKIEISCSIIREDL
ncbi:MAG: ankyrin repeat protein [Candidatus Midichloriaceae bacterium]|jgi:ankyrin repeat protein